MSRTSTRKPAAKRAAGRTRRRPARSDGSYEIGYGRPPEGTRWPQGVSGNPSGRPRKAPKLMDLLETELDRYIVLQDPDGRQRRSGETYRARILRRLVTDAARGDYRSTALVLKYLGMKEGVGMGTDDDDTDIRPDYRVPSRDEQAGVVMAPDYALALIEGRAGGLGDEDGWGRRRERR